MSDRPSGVAHGFAGQRPNLRIGVTLPRPGFRRIQTVEFYVLTALADFYDAAAGIGPDPIRLPGCVFPRSGRPTLFAIVPMPFSANAGVIRPSFADVGR